MPSLSTSVIVVAAALSGGSGLPAGLQTPDARAQHDLISSVAATEASEIYFVAQLRVTQPQIVLGPSGHAAGFLVIENRGSSPDRLTGAVFDATDRATLKSTTSTGAGPAQGLDIAPGQKVALSPGTDQIALDGLHRPMRTGDMLHGVLRFERAGPLDVDFPVEAASASGGAAPSTATPNPADPHP